VSPGDVSPAGPALVPLPAPPAGVPWPTTEWPTRPPAPEVGAALDALLDRVCDDDGPLATTHAVVVVQGGAIVAEPW
jgi:hypothetical protein